MQYKKVASLMIISLAIEHTDLMSNVEPRLGGIELRSLVLVLFGSTYACYKRSSRSNSLHTFDIHYSLFDIRYSKKLPI